jgi:BMFP domain-containing protein YqiC
MDEPDFKPWYTHGPEHLTKAVNDVSAKYLKMMYDELGEVEGIDKDDLQIQIQIDVIDREAFENMKRQAALFEEDLEEGLRNHINWLNSFDPDMN